MRVLVTGGHGFIGSHVLGQLVEAGHAVGCFDVAEPSPVASVVANEVEQYRGDVTDPYDVYDAVTDFEPDRIVHLVSLLSRACERSPRNGFDVNLGGSISVLEAAAATGVERVVAASSISSYGSLPLDDGPLDETVVQQPRNIYGLTKYALERVGESYQARRGVEFVALEPVHGLGPDRLRGNVEDAFVVKAAVSGTPITVPRVEHPFEVVYVEDEAAAFVAATLADSVPHSRYVVGTGEHVTLARFLTYVRDHVPDAELRTGAAGGGEEIEALPPTDTTRIRTDLGWKPSLSIEEAVAAYVEWLRENPEKWSFDAEDTPWE